MEESLVRVVFSSSQEVSPNAICIRTLKVANGKKLDTLYTPFTPNHSNRMVDRYGSHQLLLVHFDHDIPLEKVQDILMSGVIVDNEEFQFLGCSASGLKSRKCYMFKGSTADVERVLSECGNFNAIKSVSKRLKRIGLLFSEAIHTKVEVLEEDVVVVDDIESKAGNFTDGCGGISPILAQKIIGCIELDGYLPSVYQIRYDGCKGVVSIDPSLKENKLMIRKSMKKFESGHRPFLSLWLCAHSRPYRYGKLNRQFIMLLSGLGVEDDVFLEKQRTLFSMIESMTSNPEVTSQMLFWDDQPETARSVAKCLSLQAFQENTHLCQKVKKIQTRFIAKAEKLSLFIEDSRMVFGVCDQFNILCYGQCYIRPVIRGTPSTIVGKVVIAKSPSYLLGDIRVLEAVDIPQLHHLVDCIVFPTQGKQPHPNEIAGSDLDGDEYFVCWDPTLLPPTLRNPYDYPPTEGRDTSVANRKSMIAYVSKQNEQSAVMGKIDSCYQYFANLYGVGSDQCEQLGRLFSRSVDSTKTGDFVKIPPHLQRPRDPKGRKEPAVIPVWVQMKEISEKRKSELVKKLISEDASCTAVSEDFIWTLLGERALGISEFKLFQFILEWCHTHYPSVKECTNKLTEFSKFIDFGKFTLDERITAMDVGIPKKLVMNALNGSNLLSPDMLEEFSMHAPHCGWSFYLCTKTPNFSWEHVMRAIQGHPESLIVLYLGNEITVAVHFLTPVPSGRSDVPPGSIATYFFSSHFGYKLRHILGHDYNCYIDLDDELLQLYRNQNIGQTFLWLKGEQFGQTGMQQCEEDILRISIDLTRFQRDIMTVGRHPRVNKQDFREMEVYVKSASVTQLAYFDLYLTEQPTDWSPQLIIDDELEELVMTDEAISTTGCTVPTHFDSTEEGLGFLKQAASAGDLCQFLKVIQVIPDYLKSSNDLTTSFQELLAQVVVNHTHRGLDKERLEALQIITTSVMPLVSDPVVRLALLSHVSRLHCPELLQQIVASLLSSLELKEAEEFITVCSKWEYWYYLPPDVCQSLYTRLYALSQSLLAVSDCQAVTDVDVVKLATNKTIEVPIESSHARNYACHFMFLLLRHLIDEFNNRCLQSSSKVSDTSHRIIKFKAYDVKNPHKLSQPAKSEDGRKTWRVGFSRSQCIQSGCLPVGTCVAINLMTKDTHNRVRCVPIALGTLVDITRNPANVVIDVRKPVPQCLLQSTLHGQGHWELCNIGTITFKRATKALRGILNGSHDDTGVISLLVRSFVSTANETSHVLTPSPPTNVATASLKPAQDAGDTLANGVSPGTKKRKSFNSSQEKAITAALTQRLTLIHGPPGTGKTSVACEIVHRVLRSLGKNEYVLVTAETNMAVDNLTRRLLQNDIDVVRVGSMVAPDLHHITLDHNRRGDDTTVAASSMRSVNVLAATCTGAGDPVFKGFSIPYVIIDEATQVTEPISLLPLLHHCQQIVLIGDPHQLSPTLPNASSPQDGEHSLPSPQLLAQTLFHRLQPILPPYFLEEQYRMHSDMAWFPSQKFYDGRLKTAHIVTERPHLKCSLFPCRPVTFIDVHGGEKRSGTSFINEKEVSVVIKVIKCLIDDGVSPLDIGVLTPYTAQVKTLKDECVVIKEVEICTIDGFQGREKDIIIFSAVRSNSKNSLGFLDDKYRINVLLTRARRGLLGIGCHETLSRGSDIWKQWLEQAYKLDHTIIGKGNPPSRDKRQPKGNLPSHEQRDKRQPKGCPPSHEQRDKRQPKGCPPSHEQRDKRQPKGYPPSHEQRDKRQPIGYQKESYKKRSQK